MSCAIVAVIDARRAVLSDRLDALEEMGLIDVEWFELHRMVEEMLVLRDVMLAVSQAVAA